MKKPDPAGVILLSIFFWGCVVTSVAADSNGYIVEPAYGENITRVPEDPVLTSLWDLPPRYLVITLVLYLSPVLVFPVELFFALKVFAYLGYRKFSQKAIFGNQNRREIYEAIQTIPGIQFNTLSQLTGINRGTVRYHLALLRMKGKIIPIAFGGSVRYFENRGRYSDDEMKILRHLTGSTDSTILNTLLVSPGLSQKEIADRLGISQASVSWHMHRFDEEGIVISEKQGRFIRFSLTEPSLQIVRKYRGLSEWPVE